MSKFTESKKINLLSVVISIIFVSTIALSCGGGGGGDSGGGGSSGSVDRNEAVREEITFKTRQLLSDQGQAFFKGTIEDASIGELEELNDALEELMESMAVYEEALRFQQEQEGMEAFSRAVIGGMSINGTVDTKKTESIWSDIFGNIWNKGRRAFLMSGQGYSQETLGGAGGSIIGVLKIGGVFSLQSGTGSGTAYDFLNFKRYDYDQAFCASSAGVAIGAKAGKTADASLIGSQSLLFGFSKDQIYDGGLSLGLGFSPGISAAAIAGLGLSASITGSIGVEGSCSWTDCIPIYGPVRDLFGGKFTNEYGFSLAAQVTGSLGSGGAEGNLSVEQSYTCSGPASSVVAFLNDPNPKRPKVALAGIKMAMEILKSAVPGPLAMPAASTAFLYGLVYDRDLITGDLDPVVGISVTAPTAGAQWQRGTTQTIRWTSSGSVGNVQLQLRDSSGSYSVIANSVANTGSYNWAIPANGVIDSGYQIRVSDVNQGSTIFDHSESFSLTSGSTDPGDPGDSSGSLNYEFEVLILPGYTYTYNGYYAQGINDYGLIVGGLHRGAGWHDGFVYDSNNGTFTEYTGETLHDSGRTVNNHGDIGWETIPGSGVTSARVEFADGEIVSLLPPNRQAVQVGGISNDRTVVGSFVNTIASNQHHGFIYKDGIYTIMEKPADISHQRVGKINNNGMIVGWMSSSSGSKGYIYDNDEYSFYEYPGATETFFFGVNDYGKIVGTYKFDGYYKAFLYNLDKDQFIDIGFPGSSSSNAYDINNLNEIVGAYTAADGKRYGFIARPKQ